MSQFFFVLLLILSSFLRPFVSILAVILRSVVPFIRKRLDFERKNFLEDSSKPFKKADFCFEVSSEGELEQVRPLLEKALLTGKNIELLYSSPSVENKCQALYSLHSKNLRLLRIPLLSSFPFHFLYFQSLWQWVKSPVIIFCRYDFFPELMLLKFMGKKKFVLVSGAIKKRSWYKDQCFKFFDVIVAATDHEKESFRVLLGDGPTLYSCDFRIPRIIQRFNDAQVTLNKKDTIKEYLEKIKSLPAQEKIILGSAWESDLKILNQVDLIKRVRNGHLNILIAPHKISDESCTGIEGLLVEMFGRDYVELVNGKTSYVKSPVVILQMGGILCELYSLFSVAYIGGGYERSIHSVLEPYFSNNVVITGPAVGRSTEFDVVKGITPGEIHVLNNPESFYTIIESIDFSSLDLLAREEFKNRSTQDMALIIKEILG